MGLVIDTRRATSIEHGSGACSKGSATTGERVCTRGGRCVLAASWEGQAYTGGQRALGPLLERSLLVGAHRTVQKPIQPSTLLATVRTLLAGT